MKARPILFSATMVRALLEGRKTQTRRLVKPQPSEHHWSLMPPAAEYQCDYRNLHSDVWQFAHRIKQNPLPDCDRWIRCPYGQPGDLLWVRETCAEPTSLDPGPTFFLADYPVCVPRHFQNVPPAKDVKWKPSIHMRRDQSRLTLRITDVRVQRLQEISSDDARAEGVEWDAKGWHDYLHAERRKSSAGQSFETLWQSINGADSWAANPWVWAVGFEVLHTNIDQVLAAKQAA